MMVVMLIAGTGLILAGLLAVALGIPVKEFSFGNTLIVTGVVAVCTGTLMLGLAVAVRELKNIARRLGSGMGAEPQTEFAGRRPSMPGHAASGDGGFLFTRDQEAAGGSGGAELVDLASPPPWHAEAPSRGRNDGPGLEAEPAEAVPASRRRNLLFSSTSRKERERGSARSDEPLAPDLLPPDFRPNSLAESSTAFDETMPATFDDGWTRPERTKPDAPPSRRSARTPSTFHQANGAAADRYPPMPEQEDPAPVTVLKSGVVDGMAYSLYSDGSIEAQMPEGMMRFVSLDELRAHLDQRP
jgi:hypothetical protein